MASGANGSMPSKDWGDTSATRALNATIGPKEAIRGANRLASAGRGLQGLWWMELVQTGVAF